MPFDGVWPSGEGGGRGPRVPPEPQDDDDDRWRKWFASLSLREMLVAAAAWARADRLSAERRQRR